MTAIPFADCDCTVLRSTNWTMPTGFIADETRAGVRRVRASNASEPNTFSVTLRFQTLADYTAFDDWYNSIDRKGLFPFVFRKLKTFASAGQTATYRFIKDGAPQVSNTMGEVTDVTMGWEEA